MYLGVIAVRSTRAGMAVISCGYRRRSRWPHGVEVLGGLRAEVQLAPWRPSPGQAVAG